MPVQAHVQADGGACLAGSGLDKVTHLVDEPEAVAARQLIGRGPVPGERIGEVAAVGPDLGQDSGVSDGAAR